MCGLYGFVATGERGPDPLVLSAAAQRAQTRGPHASGYSVWPASAPAVDYRTAGSVNLKELANLARDARIVVGHARLATSGGSESWRDEDQNQPLRCERLVVAHNGTVPDWREVEEARGLNGRLTDVDSETILLMVAQYQHEDPSLPLHDHVDAALADLEATSPMALMVSDGREVAVARRPAGKLPAHPLHALELREGIYFCSRDLRAKGETSRMVEEGVSSWLA